MKMKKQLDIKKLLLLNMPYILMGLFATNFGEGWRMAVGADASAKMLSFFSTLPVALASWWPSLHPLDLLVGLCCGAGLRLAVYLKSKNSKKYRHGMEYGSARWGTHEDIAPYIDPVFQNNVILTKTESLTMNSRPKDPKTARNKNVLAVMEKIIQQSCCRFVCQSLAFKRKNQTCTQKYQPPDPTPTHAHPHEQTP